MNVKRIPARFKVGDHVYLIRGGKRFPVTGQIRALDLGTLIPHYTVDFGNGHVIRVADFDLARVDEAPDQAKVV